MNIAKEVVLDLLPLYEANECSRESRQLVEEYLASHPEARDEIMRLGRAVETASKAPASDPRVGMKALRAARRSLRTRSIVMGIAIFFSLAPFSVLHRQGKTYWLLVESPRAAAGYAVIGLGMWIAYFVLRKRARDL